MRCNYLTTFIYAAATATAALARGSNHVSFTADDNIPITRSTTVSLTANGNAASTHETTNVKLTRARLKGDECETKGTYEEPIFLDNDETFYHLPKGQTEALPGEALNTGYISTFSRDKNWADVRATNYTTKGQYRIYRLPAINRKCKLIF